MKLGSHDKKKQKLSTGLRVSGDSRWFDQKLEGFDRSGAWGVRKNDGWDGAGIVFVWVCKVVWSGEIFPGGIIDEIIDNIIDENSVRQNKQK